MKAKHPSWWRWFWGGVAVAAAAMVAVSTLVLRLEQNGFIARADSERQGLLRLALWRMDSWLTPQLGREAARPYYEYMPYYANPNTYTRYYSRIPEGEVVSPSPLLTFSSSVFPIHFQVEADGSVTSPQVPVGNALDLAQYDFQLSNALIADNQLKLNDIAETLKSTDLAETCRVLEARLMTVADTAGDEPIINEKAAQEKMTQSLLNRAEWTKRTEANRAAQEEAQQGYAPQQQAAYRGQDEADQQLLVGVDSNTAELSPPPPQVEVGPLVAAWVPADDSADVAREGDHRLFYVRRVRIGADELFQGLLVDWPALRDSLVAQASNLLPDIDLMPQYETTAGEDQSVWTLATIPAELRSEWTLPYESPLVTPVRMTLGLAWLALAGACVAAGLTLRSSIDYGERRSRFASAVTHELRTPLTTFRMYSEMLDEGMVRDEHQQKSYFRTLREEAARLTALVENMLAFARVEEGHNNRPLESLSLSDLTDRLEAAVGHRAAQSGVRIEFSEAEDEPLLRLDVESIEQIVCNLVDNAIKYGCNDSSRVLQVTAARKDNSLKLQVRDFGPGIEPAFVKRIFEPFDRGSVQPGTDVPGVGIGLALSRGLAHSMGGSLEFDPVRDDKGGARFTLRVPLHG